MAVSDFLIQQRYKGLAAVPCKSFLLSWLLNNNKHHVQATSVSSPHFFLPVELIKHYDNNALQLYLNPELVTQWMPSRVMIDDSQVNIRDHFLGNGDWSNYIHPLTKHRLHQEAAMVFEYRSAFAESPFYQALLQRLAKEGAFSYNHVCIEKSADLDDYFTRHLALLHSIEREGYQERKSRMLSGKQATSRTRSWFMEGNEEEVGIALDRSGEMYRYRGGFHRFGFAQSLELTKMPVQVKLIHVELLRKLARQMFEGNVVMTLQHLSEALSQTLPDKLSLK